MVNGVRTREKRKSRSGWRAAVACRSPQLGSASPAAAACQSCVASRMRRTCRAKYAVTATIVSALVIRPSRLRKMVTGIAGSPQGASNPVALNTMSPPGNGIQDQKKTVGDNRRSNKPIMEKRRRARINNCLNELKALILDAMKKDPARHSKLEKADILEMTVKHLEGLRSEGAVSPDRFQAGYRHCLSEVAKFPGLESGLKRRLVRHLEGCVNNSGVRPAAAPTPPSDTEDAATPTQHSTIFISAGPGSGVRLVPTRLSNGDIALVLPAGVTASALGAVPTLVPLSPRDATPSSVSSEPRCFSPASSGWDTPPPPTEEPAPLALVTRRQPPEEKPWRPW